MTGRPRHESPIARAELSHYTGPAGLEGTPTSQISHSSSDNTAMTTNDRLGSSRAALTLIPIIAASGFAGLGYEMVWTRLLSVALGTEMMAVLGSVAGFFAGLAFGAFTLDGPIRRARSPRVAYAVLESVIGLWGLISVWLLPAAGRLLPPLLGTGPAPALLWTASFALPPTYHDSGDSTFAFRTTALFDAIS